MRDGARDERRDRGAMLGKFNDRTHDDLRFVRRREADEPAVIGPM